MDGIRLAIGTFTIARITPPRHVNSALARHAMLVAPVIGLALGAVAWLIAIGTNELTAQPLVAGIAAVAGLAVLTRAIHWDGLADTADGLGSGRRGLAALEVMKRSDIGPFGVITLLLVALTQVASIAALVSLDEAWWLIVAVVTGRLAVVVGCAQGVRAASIEGLGAAVAGSVASWQVATSVAVVIALAGFTGWAGPAAVIAGIACAVALLARCITRFGGVTGDVLGALVEVSTTAALVVLVIGAN